MKYFFSKIFIGFFLTMFFGGIMIPSVSAEGMLPDNWEQDHFIDKDEASSNKVFLPKSSKEGGLEQFQDLMINNVAQIIRYLLVSIAIIYVFVNLLVIIVGTDDEGNIDNAKKGMGYIILGLMLISLSSELAKIFDPIYLGGDVASEAQVQSVLQIIINYIALSAGIAAVFNILLIAFRMVTAQGEEGVVDEQKKNLQYAFTGLIVIIMADVMINRVFYPQDLEAPALEEVQTFGQEAIQLLRYALEFLGIFAVLAVILAGIYYVISLGNDEQTSAAKTILKNIVIGFFIIFFSYIIVAAITPSIGGQVIAQ
jgi:hypothetical protein